VSNPVSTISDTYNSPQGFKTRLVLFFSIFIVVFVTRIFTFLDLSFALLLLCFLISLSNKVVFPRAIRFVVLSLFFLFIYSLFITVIYGANEIIWVLKFGRTWAMAFLLFYFFHHLSRYVSYYKFQWFLIFVVAIHSVLIYFMIANESLRNAVYSVTGYIPRGPGWSRSPGVTSSFNATAIVHVTAIFFLARMEKLRLKRLIALAIILPSLIFLGRAMAYCGLLIVCIYIAMRFPIRSLLLGILVASLVAAALEATFEPQSTFQYFANNLRHALDPILSYSSETGVVNYFSTVMSKHIYFSQDWKVLLFGNSYSGHMAILGPITGETDSDIGVINSINGNGIIVTVFMYFLYLYFIYISRYGDWPVVAFVVTLCLVLTFKETGFFTSHATALLLLIVYYQQRQKMRLDR